MATAAITPCPILFEDKWLMVLHKPAGLLSHPNDSKAAAAEGCAFYGDYDPAERCFKKASTRTWLIHRLDQDTSGALLAAKDQRTADTLRDAFAEGKVRKRYHALVASSGGLKPTSTWVDHLATVHQRDRVRTTVKIGSRPNAELRYRVLSFNPQHHVTLIEIDLLTGKTHQIRVQAASRKHSVIGDDVYGDFSLNRQLRSLLGTRRLFLHAHELSFQHPSTAAKFSVKAPPPSEWTAALKYLSLSH
jgi:RluA family pseudouridine synthase